MDETLGEIVGEILPEGLFVEGDFVEGDFVEGFLALAVFGLTREALEREALGARVLEILGAVVLTLAARVLALGVGVLALAARVLALSVGVLAKDSLGDFFGDFLGLGFRAASLALFSRSFICRWIR